jgi:hypothetical protein
MSAAKTTTRSAIAIPVSALVRRQVNRLMKLAIEALEIANAGDEAYAAYEREQAAGIQTADFPAASALLVFTYRDDKWIEKRERLPAKLSAALELAGDLVGAVMIAVAEQPATPAGPTTGPAIPIETNGSAIH